MDDIRLFEPLWDNWYIKELLGEGGYGKVYKAEREEFSNIYVSAIKHIKVPASQSEVKNVMADGLSKESAERYFENFTEEIIKEIVLMSKLKGNSNIVSYEDHKVIKTKEKIEWNIFIRMEFLTGFTDYISENTITKKDIIQLGIDICKALETCQKFNIIHRDIKPENIFISETGQFKLGDFGIARQIEKTTSGLSKKGTFLYIAPEVYKGEAYGPTVDIYSLGIVMYRMLNNNRIPFMPPYPNPITHTDRETALIRRMKGEPFEKPANADEKLSDIVLKASAYNPNDRYESAYDMRKALESILYNDEGQIIYQNEDRLDISSNKYVSTGTVQYRTETKDDETMIMPASKSNNSHTFSEERATRKKSFFKHIGKILIVSCIAAGCYYFVSSYTEDYKNYEFAEKYVSNETKGSDVPNEIETVENSAEQTNVSVRDIKLGDYMKMGNYNGEEMLWRCVSFEKISGYDEEGNPIIDSSDTINEYKEGYLPLMFCDYNLCKKAFDASGTNLGGSHSRGFNDGNLRENYGSNYWGDSNIRDWLNSTATAGNIIWSCGNVPDDSHIHGGFYPYDKGAGFLTNFDKSEHYAIKKVTQKSLLDRYEYSNKGAENYYIFNENIAEAVQNYNEAYCENITDTIFLLDVQQLNTIYNNMGLEYLKSDFWLRSPKADFSAATLAFSNEKDSTNNIGKIDSWDSCSVEGIRPAFFLNTEASFKNGLGSYEEPYSF